MHGGIAEGWNLNQICIKNAIKFCYLNLTLCLMSITLCDMYLMSVCYNDNEVVLRTFLSFFLTFFFGLSFIV